ncbi:hypothetical protein RJT34_13271 [Clitoria ternatea]|uniref:Uncharacterized protein n=1 Tax=Clitoria ternatea TaxID=43366 RepID=A0AAN9JQV1_CLITE
MVTISPHTSTHFLAFCIVLIKMACMPGFCLPLLRVFSSSILQLSVLRPAGNAILILLLRHAVSVVPKFT